MLPCDIRGETISLTFIARPLDFDAQKRALAETLKVAPYWDPVWIPPEEIDNPDVVLQARTQLFHIDRVTHVVTVSDNISGEDGTLTFDESEVFYDPSSMSYGSPPVRMVRMEAEVRWTQSAVGNVDVSRELIAAFKAAGTDVPFMISSYTMAGLVDDWPLPGDSIGAGWKVADSDIADGAGKWLSPAAAEDGLFTAWAFTYWGFQDAFGPETLTETQVAVEFSLGIVKPTLIVGYEAARSRTERVTFDLSADLQAMTTDAGDEEYLTISLSSNDVSVPVDPNDTVSDAIPIGDVRRTSYLLTDRGHESVEYLIARARAELLDHARVVEIPFEVPFENIFDLSCRKSATITDDRLPGGTATGKIAGYRATGNGDTGRFSCGIGIGCCIGKGNTVSASAGTPTYVDDGYVDSGYQVRTGQDILIAGDVTYLDYGSIVPVDDGIDFFAISPAQVILDLIVTNGPSVQHGALETHYPDVPTAVAALDSVATRVCLHLKPVTGGPFETPFPLTISALMVPKQIDLEAA